MRVGLIGLSHKVASLELLEQLAKICHRHFCSKSHPLACESFVLLSTCNRTEIYFASQELSDCHTQLIHLLSKELDELALQTLYSFFGHKCFHHLLRVATGLDSALIAETEIQGQVKRCYEKARQDRCLSKELHFLFQKTLKEAKQVRSLLFAGCALPKIGATVANLCHDKITDGKILFIGASATNKNVIAHLKKKQGAELYLCNRCPKRGQAMASELNMHLLPWTSIEKWHAFHAVICATTADNHLISSFPQYNEEPLCRLLIDLSLPRNINPALAKSFVLYDIESLQHQVKVKQESLTQRIEAAEEFIYQRSGQLFEQYYKRELIRHHSVLCG